MFKSDKFLTIVNLGSTPRGTETRATDSENKEAS